MNIALFHNHYDKQHLTEIIDQMRILGTPSIHAVWMETYDHWVALEGCHRLRAASELGLIPEIIKVEYSDEMLSTILECDNNYTVSEICDSSYQAAIIEF